MGGGGVWWDPAGGIWSHGLAPSGTSDQLAAQSTALWAPSFLCFLGVEAGRRLEVLDHFRWRSLEVALRSQTWDHWEGS